MIFETTLFNIFDLAFLLKLTDGEVDYRDVTLQLETPIFKLKL